MMYHVATCLSGDAAVASPIKDNSSYDSHGDEKQV